MIDVLAERVRKLGGTTICSIGHISRLQNVISGMPMHFANASWLQWEGDVAKATLSFCNRDRE